MTHPTPPTGSVGQPSSPPLAATVTAAGELAVGGRRRRYLLVRPASVRPGATLVLVLHGSNQTGRKMQAFSGYTFDDLAARHGAVVVYPDAYEGLWNDARRGTPAKARAEGVDDVAFLTALTGQILHELHLSGRLVVAGYSNGGQMAIRLLHEAASPLTAVVLIGATQPTGDNLLVTDRYGSVPVLLIHGTRDPIVPYNGGVASLFGWRPRGAGLSAEASADYFAARNGIHPARPELHQLPHRKGSRGTRVSRQRYRQPGRPPVELYTVHGGGHVVPNRRKRALPPLGRTTHDIDTGELLWGFVTSLSATAGP